jgi:hypothetical protein
MGVGGQRHAPAALPPGKDWVPIVWNGAENLVPTRIQSPDRPYRSESLYQLSYPGPSCIHTEVKPEQTVSVVFRKPRTKIRLRFVGDSALCNVTQNYRSLSN